MLGREQVNALRIVLSEFGEFRFYSGRWMHGRVCPGVVVKSLSTMFPMGVGLVAGLSEELGVDSADHVVRLMGEAHYDNMGRDFIVYWPAVEITSRNS